MCFENHEPTIHEMSTLDILDIAIEHWNPRTFNDVNDDLPTSDPTHDSGETKTRVFTSNADDDSTLDFNQLTFIQTTKADVDAIVDGPDAPDHSKSEERDCTNKFYDARMVFETMTRTGNEWEVDEDEEEMWHDAKEEEDTRVFHLSVAHQTIAKGEKGRQHEVMFTTSAAVDAMLGNMDQEELVGRHETFDTLVYAVSTIQKLQRLEEYRPALAWKPLEVIQKTLEVTTQ